MMIPLNLVPCFVFVLMLVRSLVFFSMIYLEELCVCFYWCLYICKYLGFDCYGICKHSTLTLIFLSAKLGK